MNTSTMDELDPASIEVTTNADSPSSTIGSLHTSSTGTTRQAAELQQDGPSTRLRRAVRRLKPNCSELRCVRFWHDVLVETVVCAYYEVLIIWISVTANANLYRPSVTHFGLFAGFCVFVLLEGYGPLSGASMNPARTWAFLFAGRMSLVRALVYTACEIGGASAGAMIGLGLTPDVLRPQLVSIVPGEGVTAPMGMAIEAIVTFNLIFVSLVVTDPELVKPSSVLPCFPIAFCVGTGIMAAGTHTGGLQNPLIAFGPALCTGNYTDHWLYWAGAYAGSTVATAFFLLLRFVRVNYDGDICGKARTVVEPNHSVDEQIQGQQKLQQNGLQPPSDGNYFAVF